MKDEAEVELKEDKKESEALEEIEVDPFKPQAGPVDLPVEVPIEVVTTAAIELTGTNEVGTPTFPFVISEDGAFRGFSHQDKAVFASQVSIYYEIYSPHLMGTVDAVSVEHIWMRTIEGTLRECEESDESAVAVTRFIPTHA